MAAPAITASKNNGSGMEFFRNQTPLAASRSLLPAFGFALVE